MTVEISVVVPAYNYAHYLPLTLDSIINQSHEKWECIVVDDGSTDETRAIVQNYSMEDRRIKYLYQENAGLSAARNTGLGAAKGKFIQLLDADDLIEKNKLKTHGDELKQGEGKRIVFGQFERFDNRGNRTPWSERLDFLYSSEEYLKQLIVGNIFPVSAAMFPKKLIDIIGGFDTSLKSLEDWYFWFKAFTHGYEFVYFPSRDSGTCIRSHHQSMSKNLMVMSLSEINVREKFIGVIPSHFLPLNDERIKGSMKALLYCIKGHSLNDQNLIMSFLVKRIYRNRALVALSKVYQIVPRFFWKRLIWLLFEKHPKWRL